MGQRDMFLDAIELLAAVKRFGRSADFPALGFFLAFAAERFLHVLFVRPRNNARKATIWKKPLKVEFLLIFNCLKKFEVYWEKNPHTFWLFIWTFTLHAWPLTFVFYRRVKRQQSRQIASLAVDTIRSITGKQSSQSAVPDSGGTIPAANPASRGRGDDNEESYHNEAVARPGVNQMNIAPVSTLGVVVTARPAARVKKSSRAFVILTVLTISVTVCWTPVHTLYTIMLWMPAHRISPLLLNNRGDAVCPAVHAGSGAVCVRTARFAGNFSPTIRVPLGQMTRETNAYQAQFAAISDPFWGVTRNYWRAPSIMILMSSSIPIL